MSLEIIARIWHVFTERYIGIYLHTFLPFDELSHIQGLLGLNNVLKPIFLPQVQIQCCICKMYYFLYLQLEWHQWRRWKWHIPIGTIVGLSVRSKWSCCHQIRLSIAFTFILASKFFFFPSFLFFNEINRSKQGA